MSTARVMIVEDDRVIARDIRMQVSRMGHSVVGTTDQVLPSLVHRRAEHVEKRQTLQLGSSPARLRENLAALTP